MDPLFAMLIALYIAGKFTSNVAQDVAWKARGEDPPSYRRERERWERRRAKRTAGDGPGRRLLANAWADACAAGDERRARLMERAAERRRRKWAEADADAAEAEAREINERLGRTQTESVFRCGGCQKEIRQSEVAGYALSGDPLCRTCRAGKPTSTAPRPTWKPASAAPDPAGNPTGTAPRPAAEDGPCSILIKGRCELNGELITCPECGAAGNLQYTAREGDPHAAAQCPNQHKWTERRVSGRTVADLLRASQGKAPKNGTLAFKSAGTGTQDPGTGDSARATHEADDTDPAARDERLAPVTDLTEWRTKGTTPPITKEDIVSGETTNLAAALNYTKAMADTCGAGAASTETSIATLRNAKVSGPVIGHLARAQDLLTQVAAEFNAAHKELEADMVVKDAYQSRQGAGDKDFALQE